MKKKNVKFPQTKTKFEFMAFLEFLEKSTGWVRGKTPDTFYSQNGIDGYTTEPAYIFIKSYGDCYWRFNKRTNHRMAFISLGNESNSDSFSPLDETDYKNEINLGTDFIRNLAIKNPELWWLFVSSCSDKCRIITDKDGKHLVLTASRFPVVCDLINVVPTLEITNIGELSKIFEEDFKFNRKRSNETYLILGNGISIPFGSDLWSQLSDYLFDYLKPQYIDNNELVKKTIGNNTFSTTSLSKQIISSNKFNDAIYSCVYRKYEDSMHNSNTLLRQISITKMFNNDLKLITYNYDEFLEIDYNNYCHPDIKIRSVCNAKEDKKIPEPKILHVHGLISLDHKVKKALVLTQEEYYKTYKNNNWVVKVQEKALENNCIYIGSSMSDLFQMSIIDKVRDTYYRKSSKYIFIQPWRCYAMLCFKGLSARDIATIYCYYLNKGVRIIFTQEFEELPLKYAEIMS